MRDKYNHGEDYQEEDDEEILEFMDALTFPIDDNLIKSTEERAKSAPVSRDEETHPKAVLSLYKPKATFSAGNFIDPRMEMMNDGDGVDRINNDYIHKVRKVTVDVQKWVDKTLDDPVDLNEYIQVNIHGMERKLEKIDPVQIESAKNISNNFRNELEMALTSWKPQFLNKKKGKMLNVIGESMAPTTVLGNMSKVFCWLINTRFVRLIASRYKIGFYCVIQHRSSPNRLRLTEASMAGMRLD